MTMVPVIRIGCGETCRNVCTVWRVHVRVDDAVGEYRTCCNFLHVGQYTTIGLSLSVREL